VTFRGYLALQARRPDAVGALARRPGVEEPGMTRPDDYKVETFPSAVPPRPIPAGHVELRHLSELGVYVCVVVPEGSADERWIRSRIAARAEKVARRRAIHAEIAAREAEEGTS